jgi:hypothetical protein
MSVLKKPNKTQKTRFEVGFFRWVFWVLMGGFYIANPALNRYPAGYPVSGFCINWIPVSGQPDIRQKQYTVHPYLIG